MMQLAELDEGTEAYDHLTEQIRCIPGYPHRYNDPDRFYIVCNVTTVH